MENIIKKISFLDKIRNKIEKTISSYYIEPDKINELEINNLYNILKNDDFEDDSDSDDFDFSDNEFCMEKDDTVILDYAEIFYNNFINNNINNDNINRYNDTNYLKLYKNYKINFNL